MASISIDRGEIFTITISLALIAVVWRRVPFRESISNRIFPAFSFSLLSNSQSSNSKKGKKKKNEKEKKNPRQIR